MRTNKITILFLSLLTLFLNVSCDGNPEEDIFDTFNDFQFITFENYTSTSFNGLENGGTVSLPIRVTNPSQNDLTVNFAVEDGTAIEGTHFSLPNNSVTIPSGEYLGTVDIDFIDNNAFNETRFFTITIATVSDASYSVGTGLEGSFSKVVGIVNDDCPSQSSLWWGSITFEDVGFGSGFPATGSSNDNGDCDILVVAGNLPNNGAGDVDIYEILFTPFSDGATSGTVEVPAALYRAGLNFGTAGILDTYYYGTGTYDESTGDIIIFYTVDARNPDSGAVVGSWYTGTTIISN